ncbi:MAG TPA: hypothetical protein VNC50_16405 [Planctomycetia bacterium]|jgi:hypothetical protein|nr:hypothetical protein [Planctomycetia bacterium]
MILRIAVLAALSLIATGCGRSGTARLSPAAYPLAMKMKDALASVNASETAGVVIIAETQMKTKMITEADYDVLRRIADTALGSEWNEAKNLLDRAIGATGVGPKVTKLSPGAVELGKQLKEPIAGRDLDKVEKAVATAEQFLKVGQITAADADSFKAIFDASKMARWNEAVLLLDEALGGQSLLKEKQPEVKSQSTGEKGSEKPGS